MNRKFFLVAQAIMLALLGSVVGVAAGQFANPPPPAKPANAPTGLSASPLSPVGTGFTYQGRLNDDLSPANGLFDFTFKLYDALAGGNEIGSLDRFDQSLNVGLFTVNLDFGNTAFIGEARFLEIWVKRDASGGFTTLSPRQQLFATPYSMSAPWLGVSGKPADYNPLRSANAINSPSITENVGQHTSITIGSDGLPLISYYDATNGDLEVAHCADLLCSSATISLIDGTNTTGDPNVGQYSSITIGQDGLGLISYYDATAANLNLKVAHCDNVACTSASLAALDTGGANNVGQYTSITIGSDGLGLVSYYDLTGGNLKVAHCNSTTCAAASPAPVAIDTGGVGQHTSITIGSDGLGLVSYYALTGGNLKTAHCADAACGSASPLPATVDNGGADDVGKYTSIAIGSDGLGLISYYDDANDNLKTAHCADVACGSASPAAVAIDSSNDVGQYTSLTIGPDGLGLIGYYDVTNTALRVAHCKDLGVHGATTSTLDGATDSVGQYASLTSGVDGLPVFSYYDATGGNLNLKTVRCASPLCVSYQRRR